MTDAGYDIILYGATSFVGQIMVRYMRDAFADGSTRWAVAGRSETKLTSVLADADASDIDYFVADAHDEAALRELCAKTKVIVSTVGPYALYGDTLVKVCVETATHYCDLTGEPQWIRKMQETHEARAKETGARIVHCCGFDSIPSDLGVHFLQQDALERFGKPCTRVDMRVAKIKGGASGGTIASIINMIKDASKDATLRRQLKDPYSLCPPDHGFGQKQRNVRVGYDKAYGSWIAPFIMAAINVRVVHRSNALSGNQYGANFLYEEAMVTKDGRRGKHIARIADAGLKSLMVGLVFPPTRWVLENVVLPKPGEGPSPKEQLEGEFVIDFLGTTASGEILKCRVTGDRDPGYGSTAKMLAQAAACLALDLEDDVEGGFWTPATLLGSPLIDRLRNHAGLTFDLVE
ncbi:MAG: saccharopine dehydrogenase NADP-binding domain-containing protein [Pseudomonadota bacterium]